ncbi:LOW QUALITY PROTEIN: 5-hydroxytryptamine receptor 2B-like [Scylla paramamosain]|uniref:LOW QUALITY PROTEIN: 5-hydroxytryptamine receptor 2B-like n=1 Tax=Scylla paramamosain TaxID=85552 RepID=UPI003082A682
MPTLGDLTLPPQPPTNAWDLDVSLHPLTPLNLTTLLATPQNVTLGNLTWEEEGEEGTGGGGTGSPPANWWGLVALLVVLLTLFGNILLILAISWDRRLQNMTNYFLLSLAVTDLMVASLVMPLSIVVLVLGHFPFSSELCLLWISLDVLFCTASIMHLCTLSVDRFLSLRYPIKFGRQKTRRRVVLKIVLVWCLSLAASLPLSLMYATAPHTTIVDGVCQIPVSLFQIIGSVICFYIPLVIMLVTYALTVRLLSQKQSELHPSVLEPSSASASPSPRSLRWKKLLCKTTSTLSTSTAVSLTDGEVSEAACRPEPCGSHTTKLRRLGSSSSPQRRPPLVRYPSHYHHHQRAALVRADGCGMRGYSTRELREPEEQSFPQLTASAPAYEMSVLPPAARSAPSSTATSPLHRRHHHRQADAPDDDDDSSAAPSCEQNGDPRGGVRERCGEECGSGMGGAGSGQVAVPCSCAPRFFLEDMKAQDSQCDECTVPQPEVAVHYTPPTPRRSRDITQPQEGRSWCCCCCLAAFTRLTRRHHAREAGAPLSSPWHEGSPRAPKDMVTRAALRSGGQVTTLLQKGCAADSGSSPRGLWRQQSCSASIKFVSSKRHGRTLRMEQKATKVLGVVFFTFVLLWAPFFIANVLISCGAHIGEEMINLVTWLGYASSMVNPFFYTFFNKTFRQTFLKIIKCEIKTTRKYHL